MYVEFRMMNFVDLSTQRTGISSKFPEGPLKSIHGILTSLTLMLKGTKIRISVLQEILEIHWIPFYSTDERKAERRSTVPAAL